MKILFFCEGASLAHTARPLKLARLIDKSKHELIFAAGNYHNLIRNEGHKYIIPIYSQTPEQFAKKLYQTKPGYDYKLIKKYIEEELEIIEKIKPDLIIGDFRLTLGISAKVKKVPFHLITNTYWATFKNEDMVLSENILKKIWGQTIGSLMLKLPTTKFFIDLQFKPFAKACIEYGLEPPKSLAEAYSYADHILLDDIKELYERPLNKPHTFLGPILWEPIMEIPKEIKTHRDLIYLSFGSSGKIAGITKDMTDKTFIAATAKREYPKANNLLTYDYLPAISVLDYCKLSITNGGVASYQAISKGIPVITIPNNLDQFLFSRILEKHNLSKLIRLDQIKQLKEAVNESLNDSKEKEQLNKFKNIINSYNTKKIINEHLKELENGKY